jgi:hypothetical protein
MDRRPVARIHKEGPEMRSTCFSVFVVVMLGALIAVGGAGAAIAQQATPVAETDHPLIGAWALDTDVSDLENALTLAVFSADGSYFQVEASDPSAGSEVGVGVWESTGDSTANMTFWILGGGDTLVVSRAEIEVEPGSWCSLAPGPLSCSVPRARVRARSVQGSSMGRR